MEYDYEFVDGPFQVIVTTFGQADTKAIVAGRRRIYADPRFRPGMNVLLDHSRLDISTETANGIRDAALTASAEQPLDAGYVAIVCPTPLSFGLVRMYQSFASEQLESRLAVVESVEEAHAWLAARQAADAR